MVSNVEFENKEIELPTGQISYLTGGTGPTLVWLHHSWGNPGELDVHAHLAEEFTLVIPDMPGWGGSARPLWARTVRDIAVLIQQFAGRLCEQSITLVGAGFGAYVAAEMVCMSECTLRNVVLIGPAGVKPDNDEIMDQMMFSHRRYIEESFRDQESYLNHFGEEPTAELRELWDHSREMTARVTWKPYMYNRRLPHLLRNVRKPMTLIWGAQDKVTPPTLQDQYRELIQHAEIHTVDAAGHVVEIEQPDAVAKLVIGSTKDAVVA